MPAVANPVTFSKNSADYGYRGQKPLVSFDDLPINIGRKPIPTSGIPSYGYKVGTSTPFRPGVSEDAARSTPIRSSFTVPKYNVMENAGMNEYGSYDMPGTSAQIEEMLKGTVGQGLALGGIGTLGSALTGRNLTGLDLGKTPILGELPFVGRGLRELDYIINPTLGNAVDASGLITGINRYGIDNPEGFAKGFGNFFDSMINLPSGIASFATGYKYSPSQMLTEQVTELGKRGMVYTPGGPTPTGMYVGNDGKFYSMYGDQAKAALNKILPKKFQFNRVPYADEKTLKSLGKESPLDIGTNAANEYKGISGFFNRPRSFLTGGDGVGLFGTEGVKGTGISSVGNVLGTVGGIVSLADFIDDPSLASGLGTLAGAGASGITGLSTTAAGGQTWLGAAAPYLGLAALAASLLMNKKPSNKTGYTSIDLDEFKPVSFGMEGKKYSKENVDQTSKIMEPIIPLIQQIEEQYGVDLKGDIQVNYGGRDGLAYNIGNRDVTGFRNRLDYFDGRDQSTRDGGSIFRKTFKGEEAGKDFYKSLLGDLEALARQKQADGGGEIDLTNYRGVQRQAPQMTGAFSYGLPNGAPNTATPPKPTGGPQGVFTYGYDT